ncbi:serine/threonine-protein kinase [Streptomyces sp. NBC_00083]|uniref:serine/threonine protein kinase n=1 Tax=Streptomyces sp. NBC_00083 TaxID=2975647 RepID=UPI00225BF6D9|nr:serine/threonine-protein kinase [Streptomyces sp. NBC_00083]MCX5386528.1 serine/threonine protein kinase [Streptomyces sp. NBC_00083]
MSAPSSDLFQPLGPDDPAVVGGYRLSAVLGSGGMGKVYLTYTPGGRPIALKVIRPEFSEDPEFRRRFQQEVRAAQRVQGLYTAPVIDFDTEGAQPWLATAYVPGPSLAHAVSAHGRLPLRSVLLLTVGVAEALHVIHGAGIVHRDLKPANVLLASDGPRVIDFGIARAADATSLTGHGVSVGTPAFMAPEQASAGTVTPGTDIFALGQIAAFAAIGAPAFGEGSSHAVLYRIVHEDPDLGALPDELRPLVTRCLSRDPADRPALTEVIQMCHDLSPVPLRQGEDWLPTAVAGSITERLQLPAPAKTPPPQPAAAPTPTEVSAPPTAQPHPTPPPTGQAAPQYPPTSPGVAAAATQHAPAAPPRAPMPPGPAPAQYRTPPPGYPDPGYQTHPGYQPGPGYPAQGGHRTQPPGYGPGHPGAPAAYHPGQPPAAPRPKRTGLIIAGSLVAAVIAVVVIVSLLPDGSSNKARNSGSSAGASSKRSTAAGGSSDAGQKRTDPTPASYKGIDLTANYQLMLADNPPRPGSGGDAGVMYNHGDLYFYRDSLFGDTKVGTDNGKLVVLNNSQKGSLATCRAETRYTDKIGLDQLTDGSEICVLSDAGHIAVATYRGKSGSNDPSVYITLDLTVWRNAEAPKKSD